jgi:YhcH/YjgK/YiaL family protein
MIVATIDDLKRYRGMSPRLDCAFDWIMDGSWKGLADGRHAIQGEEIYALVQRYETRELSAGKLEAHRKYIDIQMLAGGEELIHVTPAEGLEVIEAYKPDIEFFSMPAGGPVHVVHLKPGVVAVLFPEDAHMPCLRCGEAAAAATKVVVKVAV